MEISNSDEAKPPCLTDSDNIQKLPEGNELIQSGSLSSSSIINSNQEVNNNVEVLKSQDDNVCKKTSAPDGKPIEKAKDEKGSEIFDCQAQSTHKNEEIFLKVSDLTTSVKDDGKKENFVEVYPTIFKDELLVRKQFS